MQITVVKVAQFEIMSTLKEANALINDTTLAEERLLEELENEAIPAGIREARMRELKERAEQYESMKGTQHGYYTELLKEKDFLDITTKEPQCVVHFYQPDYKSCEILDKHLQKLAAKYYETKFVKINALNAKFFVVRLQVRVLPTLLSFKSGTIIDRLVGFEELGNTDEFRTEVLEARLSTVGIISMKRGGSTRLATGRHTKTIRQRDDDDDDDDSD